MALQPWLPHATWDGFSPDPLGAIGRLQHGDVLRVIDELASVHVPSVRIGGIEAADPSAIRSLLRSATSQGVRVEAHARSHQSLSPSLLDALSAANASLLSVPVEGPDATMHDGYRRIDGDFDRTMAFIDRARMAELAIEVRTTLHAGVAGCLATMLGVVRSLGATRWLVRAEVRERSLTDAGIESALATLASMMPRARESSRLDIAVRYAPFFLRLCDAAVRASCRTQTERNGVSISASGEICPDPAVPIPVGNIFSDRLSEVYDDHPLMRALRDPDAVEGKCGACRFRTHCGGSRARALARTGNLFASDPVCSYDDPKWFVQ